MLDAPDTSPASPPFAPLAGERMDPRLADLCRRHAPALAAAGKALFWVPGGFDLILEVESAMAVGLALRGVRSHAVICDGTYAACTQREINKANDPMPQWGRWCANCRKANAAVLERAGIPYSWIGDTLSPADLAGLRRKAETIRLEDLMSLDHRGSHAGIHALSSIHRYQQGRSLPALDEAGREFVYSALVCAESAHRHLDRLAPDRVVMSHCTYVDWGPAMYLAINRGIPVTGWRGSYLKSHCYLQHFTDLSHLDFCHLSPQAWAELSRRPLSQVQEARMQEFFAARYNRGSAQDVPNLPQGTGRKDDFRRSLHISGDRPVFGVLTHINWDGINYYAPRAYPDFNSWILATVRAICQIRDVDWVVKIHPAESWCSPEFGVQQLLRKTFPKLPPHVRLVPYDTDISLPDFLAAVDGTTSVFSTGSLEAAILGKPSILAGTCNFSGKGFTRDGFTPEAYTGLLAQAGGVGPLTPEERRLAANYGYSLFIQRMIPFPVIDDPDNPYFRFRMDRFGELTPGVPLADFLMGHMARGEEFILGEELMAEAEAFRRQQDRERRARSRP